MNLRKLILILLVGSGLAMAQEKSGTIKGQVIDDYSIEPLAFANVLIKNTVLGANTNMGGFYKITDIPYGDYTISFSLTGYHKKSIEVSITPEQNNLELNVEVTEKDSVDDTPCPVVEIPKLKFPTKTEKIIDFFVSEKYVNVTYPDDSERLEDVSETFNPSEKDIESFEVSLDTLFIQESKKAYSKKYIDYVNKYKDTYAKSFPKPDTLFNEWYCGRLKNKISKKTGPYKRDYYGFKINETRYIAATLYDTSRRRYYDDFLIYNMDEDDLKIIRMMQL